MAGDGGGDGGNNNYSNLTSNYTIDTNGLWLEITNVQRAGTFEPEQCYRFHL